MLRWILLIFPFHLIAFQGDEILSQISSRGYYEFENCKLSASWYDDLYRQFELLVDEYQRNARFRETLDRADQEFGIPPQYGGYPGGMFLLERSKQPLLTFFRYCRGYRAFLEKNYPQLLQEPNLRNFLCKCDQLLETADEHLFAATEALESTGVHALPALLGDREHFGTVLKVVRYDPGPLSGLGRHYDISGLTLLLDYTDEEEEALIVAPYKEHLEISDLVHPQRQFVRGISTSVLLIPGRALRNSGVPLNPTPHGVLPLDKKRYAVIAFAMVPLKKS